MLQRLKIKDILLEDLHKAARERPQRQEMVGGELGWIVYEREQLHKAVNRERAKLNKKSLDLREIQKVERQAVGHSDYDSKFALCCMELVLDKE